MFLFNFTLKCNWLENSVMVKRLMLTVLRIFTVCEFHSTPAFWDSRYGSPWHEELIVRM